MTARVVEIVVRGTLWPAALAALDDFAVDAHPDGRTTIIGVVADQPQLVGLLDLFGSLAVQIVSVSPELRTWSP